MRRSELVGCRGFQAATVPAGERPDQAAARSSQAVRQSSRLHAGTDFAVGAISGTARRRQPHRIERRAARGIRAGETFGPAPGQVPELDTRAGLGGGGVPAREVRKEGRHADPVKSEGWLFPASFVREQLHTSAARLLVLDTNGDSMAPTVMSGDRVIVDTGHKSPTPDGLYAIRDTFECIVVKRLQLLRSSRPTRVSHFRQSESSERRSAAQRTRDRRQGAVLPQAVLTPGALAPSGSTIASRRQRLPAVTWQRPRGTARVVTVYAIIS